MLRPGDHLLIIAHTFPPYKGIGGRRWAKFAKALARRGSVVHVIHSAGSAGLLGSFWTQDIQHPNIVVHPLPQRYPTVLFKRPITTFLEKVMYRVWSAILPLVVRGNWLDKTVFWKGQLLHAADRLIRTHGIRYMMITAAPFRLFHFGVELKRRHEIRLLCDLRDTWTWQDGYGQRLLSDPAKAYERSLELEMMEGADVVTSPHPAVIDHLRRHYPLQAGKCMVLDHAIDPDEIGEPAPPRRDGSFRMIYAGSLYGAGEAEHYFTQLLEAFERVRAAHPAHFARTTLDLFITGHDVAAYAERVRQRGLQDRIVFHRPQPATEIFRRIAEADLVLIFIPSGNKDILGTKFTEVFHLHRPVVHVGQPGLVSETIVKNGLGISIPVDRLADELPRSIIGERPVEVSGNYDLSSLLLERVTDRLVRALSDQPA